MQAIIALLGILGFFVLPIGTVIGLIKPNLFKGASRKKIAGVGFGSSVGVLILAGILLPKEFVPQTTNTNEPTVAQIPPTQSEHNKGDTDTNKQPATQMTDNVSQAKPEPKEPTKEQKELVYNFCYALQATGECKNLIMRLDTEPKIQKQLQVQDIRSPNSIFGDTCTQGIADAVKDKNVCVVAWEKYGCTGSVTPRLLQESPFGNKNAILCEF